MTKLIGPIYLFKQAWSLYRRFFKILVLVVAVPFALSAINPLLVKLGASELYFLPVALVFSVLAGLGMLWAGATIINILHNQNDKIGYKEAFSKSWPIFWSLLWVAIITGFLTGGAILLFLAPGIIFTVFFLFSQLVTVLEGERGMKALLKSREYARDYFWAILGRYLLVLLVSVVVYAVLISLGEALGSVIGLLVQTLANILVTPFILAYIYLLYKNVKEVKGEVVAPVGANGWPYIITAIAGYVVFLLAVLFMVLVFTSALGGYLVGSSVTEIMNNQVNGTNLVQ